ncbi:MAG: sodium:proton antiporter [Coriobacteriia bacterium]|nr:sodium:proton antiporter [Coriobacteriia bacterium]
MRRALVAALLVIAAVPLMLAMAELPPHGSPETPAYTHVSSYYLEHGEEEAGAENIVTGVILNYRGFDTQGEVTVIFTSMAAVLAVVLLDEKNRPKQPVETAEKIPVSIVVKFIVRVLAPFIALFAVYVVLNGHVTPGGGFQGGTIAGALIIALMLVMSESGAETLLPRKPEHILQAAAPIAFCIVGLIGLVLFGDYLAYPRDEALRWLGVVLLTVTEIGIGVGGASVIVRIFRAMGADR